LFGARVDKNKLPFAVRHADAGRAGLHDVIHQIGLLVDRFAERVGIVDRGWRGAGRSSLRKTTVLILLGHDRSPLG
jgi:hypothetical protein